MAKPPTYDNVAIAPPAAVAEPMAPAPAPAERPAAAPKKAAAKTGKLGRPPVAKSMRDASSPVVLYLNPTGHKALKRYALDAGDKVKVHDLLMQAVEEWAKRKGLREPMRVEAE